MDVSKKILDKYELLQHEYLKDTGCDSLLLRHKKTGARVALLPSEEGILYWISHASGRFNRRGAYYRAQRTVRLQGFPRQGPFC